MLITPRLTPHYPIAIERGYQKQLAAFYREAALAVDKLTPQIITYIQKYRVRLDAKSFSEQMEFDQLMSDIRDAIDGALTDDKVRRMVESTANLIFTYGKDEFYDMVRSVAGTYAPFIGDTSATAVEVIESAWAESNMFQIRASYEGANTSKIVENLRQMLSEPSPKSAYEYLRNQREITTLSEEWKSRVIHPMLKDGETRAAFIAHNEVGNLYGRSTQIRYQSAGVDKYVWTAVKDKRTRPSHAEYSGNVYSWTGEGSNPAGVPGTPIRCRCVALPVFDTDNLENKLEGVKPFDKNFKFSGKVVTSPR